MSPTAKSVAELLNVNLAYLAYARRLTPEQRAEVRRGERPLIPSRARPRFCWGGNGAPINWKTVGDRALIEVIRGVGVDRALNAAVAAERTVATSSAA